MNCPNCGTVVNETTGVVTNGDDPEWFLALAELPNCDWELEDAEDWLHQHRIGDTQALQAALSLASKWPMAEDFEDDRALLAAKKKWSYSSVKRTYKNWALREVGRTNGARARY